MDIWHRPGVTNVVADAISRKWAETRGPSTGKDSADWSVQLDWEAKNRIINDIMHVEEEINRQAGHRQR